MLDRALLHPDTVSKFEHVPVFLASPADMGLGFATHVDALGSIERCQRMRARSAESDPLALFADCVAGGHPCVLRGGVGTEFSSAASASFTQYAATNHRPCTSLIPRTDRKLYTLRTTAPVYTLSLRDVMADTRCARRIEFDVDEDEDRPNPVLE